jgi:hypothetical protein
MFGRPAGAAQPSPGPVTPPPDRTGSDENREFQLAADSWGTRANFGLAGPDGRLGNLVADLWSQWWRPWALLGILILVLAVALILS